MSEVQKGLSIDEIEVPVRQVFVSPMLMGGAPRELTILNGVLGLAFILILHFFYIIPLLLVMQFVFRYMAKKDPFYFSTFREYVKNKPVYYRG